MQSESKSEAVVKWLKAIHFPVSYLIVIVHSNWEILI